MKRLHPVLTPANFGAGIADLAESPEAHKELVYRLGGGGLSALS